MGNRLIAAGLVLTMMTTLIGCSSSSTSPSDPEETLVGLFRLGPKTTYLHVCTNPADAFYDGNVIDVDPILLGDYGLAPGDRLRFELVGDFNNGVTEVVRGMGVFSSSDTLLAATESHRVPGAIDAGEGYVTGPTHGCGQQPTDIPEDFAYDTPETVAIPAGATHLFLCVRDTWYEDNSDLDDDCGVNIWKLE